MHAAFVKLSAWYKMHGRDLPWRTTRDGYAIFMSELMLQQTQVERVIPKYEAWLKIFPTWKALAAAKTDTLIHAWAGLGYNRRALFAREAAKQVMLEGEPTDEAGWQTLKGVGPYMAAALAEFVNHQRAVVIDTNVRRVAGRVFFRLPFPSLADDKRIMRVLEQELPRRGAHWDIPQAMMDLANTVCAPKQPRCEACPLRNACKSRAAFLQPQTLQKRTRKKITERIREGKKYPDRIYRGRILALVRTKGQIKLSHVGHAVDETDTLHDESWIEEMTTRLVKDGLLVLSSKKILSLPGT